jgi:hypothetical protein
MTETPTNSNATGQRLSLRDLVYRRCYQMGRVVRQGEVARMAGVDAPQLSKWIGGTLPVLAKHFEPLRAALNCTAAELTAAIPLLNSCYVIYKATHSPTKVRAVTGGRQKNGRNSGGTCKNKSRSRK